MTLGIALGIACVSPSLAASPVRAAAPVMSVRLGYTIHAALMDVAVADAQLKILPDFYDVRLTDRATGLVGFFVRGTLQASTQGTWRGARAEPLQVYSYENFDGPDRTLMRYHDGTPVTVDVRPSNQGRREPVPAALRADSMDFLSALAMLERQVAETGRCDGSARIYNGRSASRITVRTVGDEALHGLGSLHITGPALRCDLTVRVLAGFKLDAGASVKSRVRHGSVWFAPVLPGLPPLPVRFRLETDWFGDATITLTSARDLAVQPAHSVAAR